MGARGRGQRMYRPEVEAAERRVLLNGPRAFQAGDLLVAMDGAVAWWDAAGQTVGSLATGAGVNAGMGFDAQGRLYVTRFTAGEVLRFDANGENPESFGRDAGGQNPLDLQAPESIVFDVEGRAYVGTANGLADLYRFGPDGVLQKAYDVPTTVRGSDWIMLHPDQRTLYYTSEGSEVMRYDLVDDKVLADFATGLPDIRSFALQILPDGGVIVSNRASILRLDANGSIVQTYDLPDINRWFAVNLAADGTSFWSADDTKGTVARFDLATGDLLDRFEAGGRVFGLAVKGERIPALTADLAVQATTVPATGVEGDLLTYEVKVTNTGPGPASGVVLSSALPAGLGFVSGHGSQGQGPSQQGGQLRFALGALAAGATATARWTVRADAAGAQAQAVTVAGAQADPDASNDVAALATRVDEPPPPPPPAEADLAVAIEGPAGPVLVGELMECRVTVANHGPGPAANVVVLHGWPAGDADFVSASPGQVSAAAGRLEAAIGTLPAGGTATVTFVLRPRVARTLTADAGVRTGTADPVPGNNTASGLLRVAAAPVVPPAPVAPRVVGLRREGFHRLPTRLVLQFSEALDAATVGQLGLYTVEPEGSVAARGRGRAIPVASATYNPARRTVTLRTRGLLPLRQAFRLTVGEGLRGGNGSMVDGDGDGMAGGVYAVRIRGFGPV